MVQLAEMQPPVDLQQCGAVSLYIYIGRVLAAQYRLYVNIEDANKGLLVFINQLTDSISYAAVDLRACMSRHAWLADLLAELPIGFITTSNDKTCHVSFAVVVPTCDLALLLRVCFRRAV